MEGVGSRLGRASSRYGQATTVFSGPVRKWKKQWVPVSSSSILSNHNTKRNSNNNASALLLRRWTPISPTNTEEPPPRRFRYTPIVVLQEQKKEAGEIDKQPKISRVNSLTRETCKSDVAYGELDTDRAYVEERQATNKNSTTGQHSNKSHLNLDLGLKGHGDNRESDGEDQ